MYFRNIILFFSFTIASLITLAGPSPVSGKIICIDPGHGGTAATDHYRVGLNGEREEWINLRVALLLKDMLQKKGAIVFLTRSSDSAVELAARAELAMNQKADVFISIHHNATADRQVNFPIIYFHGAGSENLAGVQLGKLLAASFQRYFFKKKIEITLVSDYTIFPLKGAAVLRGSYGIPGLLAEASFFSNEEEESKLKSEQHNREEAFAFLHALELFFSKPVPSVHEMKIPLELPAFPVLEEADRMKPEALQWHADFVKAKTMMHSNDTAVLRSALGLLQRSARSFADSYVAGKDHEYSAIILKKLKRTKESADESLRAKEFYIRL